jgi:hypothetical protein
MMLTDSGVTKEFYGDDKTDVEAVVDAQILAEIPGGVLGTCQHVMPPTIIYRFDTAEIPSIPQERRH